MMGLIYKDVVALKKLLSSLLFFLFVYGGFCIAGVFDLSILIGLIAMMGMTIPMSSVAADDATHWDRYAVATPAGRRGIVAAKYLFTLLVVGISACVSGGIMTMLSLSGLAGQPPIDLLGGILASVALTLLMDAFLLPFLLKYGAEKARLISSLTFLLIFGGIVLLGHLTDNGAPLPQLPGWLLSALPVLLGLLAIGGYLISYWIAQGIYHKKEF